MPITSSITTNLNNSDIFFPITIQGARIKAGSSRYARRHIRNRVQLYLTYSNQLALGFGNINGGLTDFSFGDGFGLLDHDQRNTLHLGGQFTMPWRSYASTDVYYASGFTNGNPAIPGDHLQPHTTFDLSIGKNFGERFSVSIQGVNVANAGFYWITFSLSWNTLFESPGNSCPSSLPVSL